MKVITKNRRATFDYAIEHTLIAGIVLSGADAKSIRNGLISLKGSFAQIKHGELWLINMHVTPYPHAQASELEPTRPRKLLVSARELRVLQADREAGRTIVPLSILAGRYLKVELGVGRGKRKTDKRHTIQQRETDRAIARSLRNR
jgi:SsrA-binding protein